MLNDDLRAQLALGRERQPAFWQNRRPCAVRYRQMNWRPAGASSWTPVSAGMSVRLSKLPMIAAVPVGAPRFGARIVAFAEIDAGLHDRREADPRGISGPAAPRRWHAPSYRWRRCRCPSN